MRIGSLILVLRLPLCHSLKEKRSVLKSMIARIQNEFNVAIAEVDEQDRWQIAVLGVATVSADGKHAQQQLQTVIDWIYTNRPDVEINQTEIELL